MCSNDQIQQTQQSGKYLNPSGLQNLSKFVFFITETMVIFFNSNIYSQEVKCDVGKYNMSCWRSNNNNVRVKNHNIQIILSIHLSLAIKILESLPYQSILETSPNHHHHLFHQLYRVPGAVEPRTEARPSSCRCRTSCFILNLLLINSPIVTFSSILFPIYVYCFSITFTMCKMFHSFCGFQAHDT